MATARSEKVNLDSTPYYHCISRCVRRAFLCGEDVVSGKNFDHRKEWLETRLRQLSSVFAVDVCAYAVMSNHYHLVVRVDAERAEAWADEEVVRRYGSLFPLAMMAYEGLDTRAQKAQCTEWRERLSSLSWMMRSLNEWVARKANKEDGCRGRFWEGRFTSQPLLDEQAVLTCMVYVDLNPVRGGMAKTLEQASFTSIRARLKAAAAVLDEAAARDGSADEPNAMTPSRRATVQAARDTRELPRRAKRKLVPEGLAPFTDQMTAADALAAGLGELDPTKPMPIGMNFLDYVELVHWTGQHARPHGPSGTLRSGPEAFLRHIGLCRSIGSAP